MLAIEAAAVALKVAAVAPAATVTDAGTVRMLLSLASEIAIPPGGAAIFRVVEQVEILPPLRLPGVHVTGERTGTATPPPVVVSAGSAEPVAAIATGFEKLIDVVVALTARVS